LLLFNARRRLPPLLPVAPLFEEGASAGSKKDGTAIVTIDNI